MEETKMMYEKYHELKEKGYQNITCQYDLEDYAIEKIKEGQYFIAIHILKALDEYGYTYYDYDYDMGVLDIPTPIESYEELLELEAYYS